MASPGFRRSFTLTITDDELAKSFEQWMVAEGITNCADAARQLLRERLAFTQKDGAVRSAQMRAFNETKHYVVTKLHGFFGDMGAQLQNTKQFIEATEGVCPGCGYLGTGAPPASSGGPT